MIPLAERLRPKSLEDYIGQLDLTGENGVIRLALQSGYLPSMIFWGPPGTGKTTLLHIIYGINNLYSGKVLWDNNLAEDYNLIRQNHLSVVFQDLRLIQDISVQDNIELKNQLTQQTHLINHSMRTI